MPGPRVRRPTARIGRDGYVQRIDPREPDNRPRGRGSGTGGSSGGGSSPRELGLNSTLLGGYLPIVFGDQVRKVSGEWMVRPKKITRFMYAALGLAEGEVGAISNIKINDGAIGDISNSRSRTDRRWVRDSASYTGSDTQGLSSILDDISGHVETYPGMAYVALKWWEGNEHTPTNIKLTAEVTGRKILDFRTSTTGVSSNPILIAYHLLTDEAIGLGLPSSMFDIAAAGHWETEADHCETAMADGTPRYAFNGVLARQPIVTAVQNVLRHAHAQLVYIGGKFYINSKRTKTPRSITVESGDWRHQPQWREIPPNARVNRIITSYIMKATGETVSPVAVEKTGLTDDELVEISVSLPGCWEKTYAVRWATKLYNLHQLERYEWRGELPEALMADVLPGEIITINTPEGVSSQLARVDGLSDKGDGWFDCLLTEYDAGTDSTTTDTEDTPISLDSIDPPDVPTAANQFFGERGDWDEHTFQTNPDDLTAWTASTITAAYDAVNDWTELNLANTDTSGYLYADFSSDVETKGFWFVSLITRWESDPHDDFDLFLEYWAGADHGSATQQERVRITPYDNEGANLMARLHHRFTPVVANYHEARLVLEGIAVGAGSEPTVAVKRVRMVAYGEQGESFAVPNDHEFFNLEQFERWTWTEHGSAGDTVQRYEILKHQGDGRRVFEDAEVGETTLTLEVLKHPHRTRNGCYNAGKWGRRYTSRETMMEGLGLDLKPLPFPDATQGFEGDTAPPALDYDRTYYDDAAWEDEPPFRYENFDTFAPDNSADIDSELWSDYLIELWVDLAGGSSYSLVTSADWPGPVGFGDSDKYLGEPWFYKTTAEDYAASTHQVWLKNKYTGLRTQMSLADTIDGTPSDPFSTVGAGFGWVERYFDTLHHSYRAAGAVSNSGMRMAQPLAMVPAYHHLPGTATSASEGEWGEETIESGALVVSRGICSVDTESDAAADDLDTLLAWTEGTYYHPWSDDLVAYYTFSGGTGVQYLPNKWVETGDTWDGQKGYTDSPDTDDPTHTSGNLAFDGVNDLAVFPAWQTVQQWNSFSFSIWFRPQIGTAMYLMSQENGENWIKIEADGSIDICFGGVETDTGLDVSDNTWHFLTIRQTWGGTYETVAYLDGVEGGTAHTTTPGSPESGDIFIGCDTAKANCFEGDVAFMAYWDTPIDFTVDNDGSARLLCRETKFSTAVALPAADAHDLNMLPGTIMLLTAENAARVVTVKHGTGNISLVDGEDCDLDTDKWLCLFWGGGNGDGLDDDTWHELWRSAIGGGSTGSSPATFDGYQGTGGTAIANTATDVPIQDERVKDSGYTHAAAAAELEFDFAGEVEITADVGADCTGTARYTVAWWVTRDSGGGHVEVAGTRMYSYHRTTADGKQSASCTFTLTVADGDKIKIQGQADVTAVITTLADAVRLVVRKKAEFVPTVYTDPVTMTVKNNTGATLSARDLCYISGDASGVPEVTKADADAAGSSTKMLVMISETILDGATGQAVVRGAVDGFTSLTAGSIRYVSTTAGGQAGTAPSGTNDVIRVIGYALSSTVIFFNPGNGWVEHS